jgi:hypothetical protein
MSQKKNNNITDETLKNEYTTVFTKLSGLRNELINVNKNGKNDEKDNSLINNNKKNGPFFFDIISEAIKIISDYRKRINNSTELVDHKFKLKTLRLKDKEKEESFTVQLFNEAEMFYRYVKLVFDIVHTGQLKEKEIDEVSGFLVKFRAFPSYTRNYLITLLSDVSQYKTKYHFSFPVAMNFLKILIFYNVCLSEIKGLNNKNQNPVSNLTENIQEEEYSDLPELVDV